MELLPIYLNDHLAAATGMRELARRSASSNRGGDYFAVLAQIAVEVEEDRESLLRVMAALGVRPDRAKVIGGWAAEKLGRLKLNGRLLGYSPLSRVVEIEALLLGVRGKLALWTVLASLREREPRLAELGIDDLIARAERQAGELEEQRLSAAAEAFV